MGLSGKHCWGGKRWKRPSLPVNLTQITAEISRWENTLGNNILLKMSVLSSELQCPTPVNTENTSPSCPLLLNHPGKNSTRSCAWSQGQRQVSRLGSSSRHKKNASGADSRLSGPPQAERGVFWLHHPTQHGLPTRTSPNTRPTLSHLPAHPSIPHWSAHTMK